MDVLGSSGIQPATGDPGQVSGLSLPADACKTLTGLLTGVGGNGQAGAAATTGETGTTADDSDAAAEAGPAPANMFVFIINQSGPGEINFVGRDHDFTNGCGLDEAMQDTGVTVPVVEGGGSTPLQGVGDVSQVGLDSGHCWAMHNLFGSMHNAPSLADQFGGTTTQPNARVTQTPSTGQSQGVTTPGNESTTPSAAGQEDEDITPSANNREDANTSTTPTANSEDGEDTTPSANDEDLTTPGEDATPSPTATQGTSNDESSDSSSTGTNDSTSSGESQPLGEETPAP
jgi:hypothetical protein